jgi:cyclic pyranopterin phosphate synthase
VKDAFDRTIDYLRVSVTDRCNLRCAYCMPRQGVTSIPHAEILTLEEIERLCGVFSALGIRRIKVTGGEPLIRGDAVSLIAGLKKLPGIEQVTLTTNGILLSEYLPALLSAGIDGINISLDTLDPVTFEKLTGADALASVLRAMDETVCSGVPVKLNCVPIHGINQNELAAIASLARCRVKAVRFIELMPVGCASHFSGIRFEEVVAQLEQAYGPLRACADQLGNGPAQYYSICGFKGRIGIIDALGHSFCGSCNRVRLTAAGQLRLCLSRNDGVDLRQLVRSGASDEQLRAAIGSAIARKPQFHQFYSNAVDKTMNQIGG